MLKKLSRSIPNILKRVCIYGLLIIAMAVCFTTSGPLAEAANEIYFTIPDNYGGGDVDIYLAAGTAGSTGTITNQDNSFSAPFTVPANGTFIVTIPIAQRLTIAGSVQNKGFVITPSAPVAAYLMDARLPQASNDIAVLFPVEGLSSRYRIMAGTSNVVSNGSQVSIVATADNTTVTFTPQAALTTSQPAGVPITITLNRLQAIMYYASGTADLTASTVVSDKPVAVFSGHLCGNVPPSNTACDHLLEQMPGTEYWGNLFPLVPTARTQCPGDVLKVLADTNGTTVTITNGGGATNYNLNAGQFFTIEGAPYLSSLSSLSSNNTVLVGQFMVGAGLCSTSVGDPAFSLVPPSNLWLRRYIINVPAGYAENYIGIALPTADAASLLVDGSLPSTTLAAIPGTALVGGNIQVAAGQHIIEAPNAFMVTMHGFDNSYASYFGIAGQSISGGGAPVPNLLISTTAMPSGTVGQPYSTTLAAQGGTPAYTWSITGKAPSAGLLADPSYNPAILNNLSIDPSTGTLSWNPLPSIPQNPNDPNNPGQTIPIYYIDITIQVTDSDERTATATFRYTDPVVNASSGSGGGGGGGCFIATAAFGSYLHPDVQVLREFRDKYLLTNAVGKAFVRAYYKLSPPVAGFIREHEGLRSGVRFLLTPVVYALKYPGTFLFMFGLLLASSRLRKRKTAAE